MGEGDESPPFLLRDGRGNGDDSRVVVVVWGEFVVLPVNVSEGVGGGLGDVGVDVAGAGEFGGCVGGSVVWVGGILERGRVRCLRY